MRGRPRRGEERTRYGGMVCNAAAVQNPSPRIRLAAKLYASGAVATKSAAAAAVGVSAPWLISMTNHNDEVRRIVNTVDERIMDETVEMSSVLRTIGREAIKKLRHMMDAENPHIALKAAVDLADRNPETSKIQRHQITSMQINSADAKALAAALVEGAKLREEFPEAASTDFVRVDSGEELARLPSEASKK